MKTERLHIRIRPEDKAKLQAIADEKRRTVTSLMEEMIENYLEEEMEKTYIVMTNVGLGDEFEEYRGSDLEKAKEIAESEFLQGTENVELQEVTTFADDGINYDYDLIDYVDWKRHLGWDNLMNTYANGDGTMDLEFQLKGKKAFIKGVQVPEDIDEWYWDDKDTVDKAVAEAKEIEIH